jgi:hypothetical protein
VSKSRFVANGTLQGGQSLASALSGSALYSERKSSVAPLMRRRTRAAAFQINIKRDSVLASKSSLAAQSLFNFSKPLCGSVGRICALFVVPAASTYYLFIT